MARRVASHTAKAVATLQTMSLHQLRAEWQRRRVLAWRMLEKDHREVKVPATSGMRLAREWAGRRHEVCVIESGLV